MLITDDIFNMTATYVCDATSALLMRKQEIFVGLSIYVPVCVCACVCVCVSERLYVHVRVCDLCMFVYVCVFACVCSSASLCVCMEHACAHVFPYIRVCVRVV